MIVAIAAALSTQAAKVKTPETSKLFDRFVDPQSGVVSYVLKPGSVAWQQQSLYYCVKSMTDDGRFLVFDVYDGHDEIHDDDAGNHREFAVIDFLKDEVTRLGSSTATGKKHPCPYLDVKNDVLYYYHRGSETLRKRDLLADPMKEIVLCDMPREVLEIGRVRDWATHMTMNADCSKVFLDPRITPKGTKDDRRILGVLDVKTGKWTQWSEVDFPANHAAVNPVHDDLAYIGHGNFLSGYNERRKAAKKRGEGFGEPFLSMFFLNPKGELRPFAPEAINHATHQTWSDDGTYLYWCSRDTSKGKWGVYAIDPWTMKQRCVAPVRAMHAYISPDNRYVVFDWPHPPLGRGSGWETAFYDCETHKQVYIHSDRPWIADIANGEFSRLHPDAHPNFVMQGRYVVSTFNTDDHRMTISLTPTEQLKQKTK